MKNQIFIFLLYITFSLGCGQSAGKHPNTKSPPNKNSTILGGRVTSDSDTFFRAAGTEPFWSVLVTKEALLYSSPEQTEGIHYPLAVRKKANGRPEDLLQLFILENETGWLLIRKAPCSDGMSDFTYPYQATFYLQGNLYEGCAR